jgi:xylose dehydrogenase (NAD/NADP)
MDESFDSLFDGLCDRDWETTPSDDRDELRFAVVGVGWFTRGRALPALEASDVCSPTVVVSSSESKASRVVAELDADARGLTYDQFLDGEAAADYDAVYVVTPNARHLEHVESAARRGKHVLCEKPMERDVDRAEAMVDACEAAGVKLMIAYRMHTEPAVRRARDLIAAGAIGEPQAVRGTMSQRLLERIDPDPDQWRLDAELAGGGALFDIGLYPLNTARFLLDADPVAVVGRTRSSHDAFDEVEETVSFTATFPGGVSASCFASHNARQSSRIYVTGTEGQVDVEPAFFQDQQRVLHASRGDGRARIEISEVDQMLEEFDYFAHQIATGSDVYADGEHGLVDMRAMTAIYESEAEGGWVEVPGAAD